MSKEKKPPHPGEILLREFIEPQEISTHRLAKDLCWDFEKLEAIIQGEENITEDEAFDLSEILDVNPDFWLNLQQTWDVYKEGTPSIDSDFEYKEPE